MHLVSIRARLSNLLFMTLCIFDSRLSLARLKQQKIPNINTETHKHKDKFIWGQGAETPTGSWRGYGFTRRSNLLHGASVDAWCGIKDLDGVHSQKCWKKS